MEPIINQQMPNEVPKNKTWLWIVLIIVVALLASGGVYYWQSLNIAKQSQTAAEKVRAEMQLKITEAETKNTELQNKIIEQEEKITTLTKVDFCTIAPTTSAIGNNNYPIDDRYQNLGLLGQLFTASDCGDKDRLNKIFGVNGENYTLGSNLSLTGKPSMELLIQLKKIGFTCKTKDTENNCLGWRLDKTVKVNDLIQLKTFYNELNSSDCINCG
ncbi:MAG: hypothetical protein WCV69_04920 [Patescibacteria group bacterium]|jgi:hypothetical protein